MATKRRRITKEERARRDELMWCVEMAHIMVLRRMFDERWTDEEIAAVYRQTFADCAELLMPDRPGLPIQHVASMVFDRYESKGGG